MNDTTRNQANNQGPNFAPLATAHILMPKEIRDIVPALYATEHEDDPMVVAKFFDPCGSWTWFVIEFDGDDTFFGLVDGFACEMGYFSLAELTTVRHAVMGLPLERDLHFTPAPLSEVRAGLARRRPD